MMFPSVREQTAYATSKNFVGHFTFIPQPRRYETYKNTQNFPSPIKMDNRVDVQHDSLQESRNGNKMWESEMTRKVSRKSQL